MTQPTKRPPRRIYDLHLYTPDEFRALLATLSGDDRIYAMADRARAIGEVSDGNLGGPKGGWKYAEYDPSTQRRKARSSRGSARGG